MTKKSLLTAVLINIFLLTISFTSSYAQDTNQYDSAGNKHGFWEAKYESGQTKYKGHYDHGARTGEFLFYFESGVLKAKSNFYDKGNKSKTSIYNPNGQLLAEGYYTGKMRDSIWTMYDTESGLPLGIEVYKNMLPNGIWKNFYPGTEVVVRETKWEDGQRHGSEKEYFENSQLKNVVVFQNDLLEGPTQSYLPDGSQNMKGQYKNNKRQDLWIYFNEEGETELVDFFNQGLHVFTYFPKNDSSSILVSEDDMKAFRFKLDSLRKAAAQ